MDREKTMKLKVPTVSLFDIFSHPTNYTLEQKLQIQDASIFAERRFSGITVEDEMKLSGGFLSIIDDLGGTGAHERNSRKDRENMQTPHSPGVEPRRNRCLGHWRSRELSEDLRQRIVDLYTAGLRSPTIAKRLNLSRATVVSTLNRFKNTGSVKSLPRSGRPKKLNVHARSLIEKLFWENEGMNAAGIAAKFSAMASLPVSPDTIRRTLDDMGLQAIHPKGPKQNFVPDGDSAESDVETEDEDAVFDQETESDDKEENQYVCLKCDRTFNRIQIFKQHLAIHSGVKKFSCDVCGKRFSRKGSLKSHQLIHSGNKDFQCKACPKKFKRKGDLSIHMRSHSDERPYCCDQCGKMFKCQAKLTQHKKCHTDESPFQCDQCPKHFKMKVLLTSHKRTHNKEKGFECKVCLKAFNDASNLRKHATLHTGEKPFSCSFCEKKFRIKQHWLQHEMRHRGECPFVCDKCGKSFVCKSLLQNHVKTHVKADVKAKIVDYELKYGCKHCTKRFQTPVSLKLHMQRHEEQHECQECGKKFNDKSNMRKHMMTIHLGERLYECEVCGNKFKLKHHRDSHQERHRD